MPLTSGTKLGQYEVVESIGAGGMGEVYRARDTKLGRDVAIKVLPEEFARDKERLDRFQREARLLAQLNHTNIATLHGLEEHEGQQFLVMELVEGETLAERIAQGPLPVDEAIPLFIQIAEGLEAAHEKGIIHRDLKPANIKIGLDGKPKILDFGLAKAFVEVEPAPDSSQSPTLTRGTALGVILGTAAYMSPEQAKGKVLDVRTDIWAFGCCLYESLLGKRPFPGESAAETLAKVLERDPEWASMGDRAPASVERLLRRCLQKDRRERLRHIGDARLELREARHGEVIATTPRGLRERRGRFAAGLIGTFVIGMLVGQFLPVRDDLAGVERVVTRSTIDLPLDAPLPFGSIAPLIGFDSPTLALSPDATKLVYVGRAGGHTALYLREIDSFDIRQLPGTEGAHFAFFSPGGDWVGFLTSDKVKKVSLRGDSSIALCDSRIPVRASWAHDDVIYFSEDAGYSLSRVDAQGGEPVTLVDHLPSRFAAARHASFGEILPETPWALVTIWTSSMSGDYATIAAFHLNTLETKPLLRLGYDARYVESGHLIFVRGGSLLAVPFDLERMEPSGEPVTVVRGTSTESLFGQGQFAVSASGTLAYVPGTDAAVGRLAFVDREGVVEPLGLPVEIYGVPDISPDGRQLAIEVADLEDFVRIYDLETREARRFATAGQPVWVPTGDALAYSFLDESDRWAVARQRLNRSQEREVLFTWDHWVSPNSWSPDGWVLGVSEVARRFRMGFLDTRNEPRFETTAMPDTLFPSFSPDGSFIAYQSFSTTDQAIWVQSTDGQIRRQISGGEGTEPLWCENGELFWRNGNRFLATKVTTQPELTWEPPRMVFETDYVDTQGRSYDVSPDGQRLLIVQESAEREVSRIRLVENWFQELERLVPTES